MVEVTYEADEEQITITAARSDLHAMGNAVFAAYYDARFPRDEGESLEDLIPSPNDTLESATFAVSPRQAHGIADAIQEAADYADDDGRAATGRRLKSDYVDPIRFAVAVSIRGE